MRGIVVFEHVGIHISDEVGHANLVIDHGGNQRRRPAAAATPICDSGAVVQRSPARVSCAWNRRPKAMEIKAVGDLEKVSMVVLWEDLV